MLNDELNISINSMKQLHRAEEEMLNLHQKQQNDLDYKNFVAGLTMNLEQYQYAHKNLNFELQRTILQSISDCLNLSENIVSNGRVEKELLNQVVKKINKGILPIVRKEWRTFYNNSLPGYEGNLEILSGLTGNADEIKEIRTRLRIAADWDRLSDTVYNKTKLERYKEGIDQINIMLAQQNLNNDVKKFLKAVSAGNADFNYLTDEVINWIHQQHMETRLSIRFSDKTNSRIA